MPIVYPISIDVDGFLHLPGQPPIKFLVETLEDGRVKKTIVMKDVSGDEQVAAEKTD